MVALRGRKGTRASAGLQQARYEKESNRWWAPDAPGQ